MTSLVNHRSLDSFQIFQHMTFRLCKFIDTASWKWRIIQGTRICGCIRFPLMTCFSSTLPETNIAHENPIFPGKYHQNGGFSMAMLVYRSVIFVCFFSTLRVVCNGLGILNFTSPGLMSAHPMIDHLCKCNPPCLGSRLEDWMICCWTEVGNFVAPRLNLTFTRKTQKTTEKTTQRGNKWDIVKQINQYAYWKVGIEKTFQLVKIAMNMTTIASECFMKSSPFLFGGVHDGS